MDKTAALGAIARFSKAIEAKGIRINKLILYGSYARGDYREGSDIDLNRRCMTTPNKAKFYSQPDADMEEFFS
ncbi:MAG: hypothetical protein STSR0003_23240 [Smithella sp.]